MHLLEPRFEERVMAEASGKSSANPIRSSAAGWAVLSDNPTPLSLAVLEPEGAIRTRQPRCPIGSGWPVLSKTVGFALVTDR